MFSTELDAENGLEPSKYKYINKYIYIYNIYKYIVSVYINGGLPPTAVYINIYI